MNAATAPEHPVLFLRHHDGDPIVFYLASRVSGNWANWIRSHGGSVATNPADAQFVIFPSADLTPREQLQQDAFRKRDVPTVLEQWLVRMRRFGRITSWTQWACDPVYRTEPLVEDHELAVQLRMHGVDNTEYQSVDFSEVDRILSRRFPHHPIEWFREQRRGYRPDNFSSMPVHQEVPESPPAAVLDTPYLNHIKQEPTMQYLPTPTSSTQQSQSYSQFVEEEGGPYYYTLTPQVMTELFLTPSSDIFEAANSPTIPLTQDQPLELGSGDEGQDQEDGIIPGSPEDENISDSPISGVGSSILEQQAPSPIPLEQLFQGTESPMSSFSDEMDLFNCAPVDVPPLPPRAATINDDATEQLLHGIDGLSHWEPTPSIHSYARRDVVSPTFDESDLPAPPLFDESVGLWHHSNTSGEIYHREENVFYEDSSGVQASRVRNDELQYGWELIEGFIQTSIWITPARLGKQINRLFRVHGGEIDWVEELSKECNYAKVQALRREWRETHWHARNPDAEMGPPTHKWFTFGQAVDPATDRGSRPEWSDDERDELNIRRSRPKTTRACTSTSTSASASTGATKTRTKTKTKTAAGRTKRKRAAGCSKTSRSRRVGVLGSSSSPSSSSSVTSCPPGREREEGLSDSEWSRREKVSQGRKKRRRLD